MINLSESLQRRDFLKQLGLASAAALASPGTQLWGNEQVVHPAARADSCILLWMAGGMAAPDTLDPKAYLPYEDGLEVKNILIWINSSNLLFYKHSIPILSTQ